MAVKERNAMASQPHQHAPSTRPSGGDVVSFADRLAARRTDAAAPAPAGEPGRRARTRARVAAVTDQCWCCREKVRAVVGVIVDAVHTPDGSGFLPLEGIDAALLGVLDPRALARRGIGQLRHRESPGVEGGYVANGCPSCDALIGRFHLEDLLTEHRMAGGSFGQLDIGIAVELELAPAAPQLGLAASG